MSTFAAVMTGKGTGAISTIQVFGDSAEAIIKKIFKPVGTKPAILQPGKILLGTIVDGAETIDQVTIGCEGADNFAIHCHGNPLIVEMIMRLLQRHGVTLLTAEELLTKILSAERVVNTIALEAKLTQPRARTLEGTKIIANQVDVGLSKKAREWLDDINAIPFDEIAADAETILENSQIAKLIIRGCKVAIAGPPNTGKSTLLNCLCGRQKAIVTDIKGTTRDWVSGRCQIGPLSVELIDTAGLSEGGSRTAPTGTATPRGTIENAAQKKTAEILEQADLVLLVLDNSATSEQLDDQLLEKISGTGFQPVKTRPRWPCHRVLTVLNKSDLPTRFDVRKLPEILANTVQISAKLGAGIEKLTEKIQRLCGVADFDLRTAVCFTSRQEKLLRQLKKAKSKQGAVSIISELLNGEIETG